MRGTDKRLKVRETTVHNCPDYADAEESFRAFCDWNLRCSHWRQRAKPALGAGPRKLGGENELREDAQCVCDSGAGRN